MNATKAVLGFVHATVAAIAIGGCATTAPPVADATRAQLAPGGKLRVAMLNLPAYITPTQTGELRGISVDFGTEMAKAVGATFEPVRYSSLTAMLADARTGAWDIAFMGHDLSRTEVEFTEVYLHSENAVMVPASSSARTLADLNRPGVRIATTPRSVQERHVKTLMGAAQLVTVENNAAMVEALKSGRADAMAAGHAYLRGVAATGAYRVLDEKLPDSPLAVALPKGRTQAREYATQFVRYAKSSGMLQRSVDDAKAPGVTVPR